jgi:hypothetical protein
MFMTTDARIRSSYVTFEPASASCSGQPRALRLGGHTNIAAGLRWTARDPSRSLTLLGIT